MRTLPGFVATFLLVTAAGQASPISEFFSCLEARDRTVASAHRGGPGPGFAENALSTLNRGYDQGVRVFEVDVATAGDGTLFLLHDRTLDRTTNGTGPAADLTWPEITRLKLKDPNGDVIDEAPTALTTALAWAVAKGAFLTLDFKNPTTVSAVARTVQLANAQGHVLYLANSLERARAILKYQPDAMISLGVGERQSLDDIEAAGPPADQVMIWTGFRRFDSALVTRLDNAGLRTSFGTLGFGDSYDDRFAASGSTDGYGQLARSGLHMIATDRPRAARDGLLAAGRGWDSSPACRW